MLLLILSATVFTGWKTTLAGTSAWQTVTGAGFQLMAPSGWHQPVAASPPAQGPTSLKQTLTSADGRESLKVYASPRTIRPADIRAFLTTYLSNVAGLDRDAADAQSVVVPGAANAAAATLGFTPQGGARTVENVLAVASDSSVYVLEIVAPEDFATQNSDLIDAILQSFAVTTVPSPTPTPSAPGG